MLNQTIRDKYYNRIEGVLFVDESASKNEALIKASQLSGLTFVAQQVDSAPNVPRLETRQRRVVGTEAVIAFLNEHR